MIKDASSAIIIAIIIIVLAVCFRLRIAPQDIVGFWRPMFRGEPRGGEYRITQVPIAAAEDHARLLIEGRNADTGPVLRMHGMVRFLRKICIDGQGGKCGRLDLTGRHIDWGGGETWIREGILHCKNCIT